MVPRIDLVKALNWAGEKNFPKKGGLLPLVFRVIPKKATFQTKLIKVGLKTGAISKGNFLLDCR